MDHRLSDIGDVIWRSIQENRTPLTDALLRIIIILAVSMCVLWILEGFFAMLHRRSNGDEANRNTVLFIFTMIRYVVLIISILIILRSCITEITYGQASSIRDMILWLHGKTVTIYDYGIKLLVALIAFIVFNAIQNGFFNILKRHLDQKNVREGFTHLVLNLVRYILLAFFVVAASLQMIITDGNSIIALAIYAYLCILIGVPTREIRRFLTEKSHSMEVLITLVGRITAMIILVALGFGVYAGLQFFLSSGGRDISPYLTMDEKTICTHLDTTFEDSPDLSKAMSQGSREHVTVRSDGELNLIYIDGKLTGYNTTGREYQIYGVAINQPEISAVHNMMYGYDGSMREVSDFSGGASDSHYYYNNKRNDCLVLTVNRNSNRVVSVTFYNNYHLIAGTRTLTEE